MKKEQSDEVVAEAFLKNLKDLSLFEELMVRYEVKLIRYVRSLGIEQNLAEDVVQECFVKAYRKIRSFNPKKGKWSSWIYRIAHNCAMDSFKKQKKDLTVDEDEWWEGIAVPETISEELNLKINAKVLNNGLVALDSKYREPLILYFIESKGYKEIGEILRMPTATVSTRIKRGKESLKKILQEQSKSKLSLEEVV
jgi:RNA polymerase sigma-70 factor (ECF subfamily)